MELKEVIKSSRKVLAISQLDLAEMSEVRLATVKDIELGKGNPSLSTVNKLLGVLGLEMDFKIRKTIL